MALSKPATVTAYRSRIDHYGDADPRTLTPHPRNFRKHPKPQREAMAGVLDISYEPFLGSGTTMVAAEQLGRRCFGMEIEPKYVAVALERLAGMGLEPRLSDG